MIRPPIPVIAGKENPIVVYRNCDACGIATINVIAIQEPEDPVIGNGVPPFVCVDFRACCNRWRNQ